VDNDVLKVGKYLIIPLALVSVGLYVQGQLFEEAFWSHQRLPVPARAYSDLVEKGGQLWVDGTLGLVQGAVRHWGWSLLVGVPVGLLLIINVMSSGWEKGWWLAWTSALLWVLGAVNVLAYLSLGWGLAGWLKPSNEAFLKWAFGTGILGTVVGVVLLSAVPKALTSMKSRFINERFTKEAMERIYVGLGLSAFLGGVTWLIIVWPVAYGRLREDITTAPVQLVLKEKTPDSLRSALQHTDVQLVGERGGRLLLVVGKQRTYWEVPTEYVVCVQHIASSPTFPVPALPTGNGRLWWFLEPVTGPLEESPALLAPVGHQKSAGVTARWRVPEDKGIDRCKLTVTKGGKAISEGEYDKGVREVRIGGLAAPDINGSEWTVRLRTGGQWKSIGSETIELFDPPARDAMKQTLKKVDELSALPGTARAQMKFWEMMSRDDCEGARDVSAVFLGREMRDRTYGETLLAVRAYAVKCHEVAKVRRDALVDRVAAREATDDVPMQQAEEAAINCLDLDWALQLVRTRKEKWEARGATTTGLTERIEELTRASTLLKEIEGRLHQQRKGV
jgi:hypothetical protein